VLVAARLKSCPDTRRRPTARFAPEVAAGIALSPVLLVELTAMKIALGADHAGYELKEKIKQHLAASGVSVDDQGTGSSASVDYPDFARKVAENVAARRADRGILVCGSGIGMAIAANKVPGVRAANVTSEHEAQMSREHNDANVLALGARIVDTEKAFSIVDKWLQSSFAGGRHQQRVDKIGEIEREELQSSRQKVV
jgi:ribose 5-phosphate isomerase B